jgi:hypothetical protein
VNFTGSVSYDGGYDFKGSFSLSVLSLLTPLFLPDGEAPKYLVAYFTIPIRGFTNFVVIFKSMSYLMDEFIIKNKYH